VGSEMCIRDSSYTAGILWYLYETGRNIPKDVKIVASNDDYAAYLCPPVTTYSLSNESVCTEALDMLIRLQSPRERDNIKHVYLTPKFTIRKSTE
jgi:DNA-binding LacI/PurR family transcriptional regulator